MQHPDGKPGYYYVTAQDRGRTALLLGPFEQRRPGTLAHRQALGLVTSARRAVNRLGYRDTAFATFGTCRAPLDGSVFRDPANPPVGKLGRHKVDL